MQAERCPVCKSESIYYSLQDEEFEDGVLYKTWSCTCDNGHEFNIAEEFKLIRWTSEIENPDGDDEEIEHFEE